MNDDELIGIGIGSLPAGDGVIQQRMWFVDVATAEQVAEMLDGMGFEKISGLVDSGRAQEFGDSMTIVEDF